jgi:radical SAM protein with 4Fe4S-binding SPASM domain
MPKKELYKKILQLDNKKHQIVTLILTRNCNLRCRYCYENHKSKDNMDFKTATGIITHYMEIDNGIENVEVHFFGGEPMLCFSLIKEIVEWFHSNSWEKKCFFFIPTNGTILTPEMKSWFLENRESVIVGFSLDGNRVAHNLSRDNSYDLILPNIPFFQENWPMQPAKMTICAETIPYVAESIIELENMGLNFTANVVFEDIWGSDEKKTKLLNQYQEQLRLLVEFYTQNSNLEPVRPIFGHKIEYYDYSIPTPTNDCVRFCGAGHEHMTVDVDGNMYPCQRFIPWITDRPTPKHPQNRQKEWEPQKCNKCKLLSICPTCVGFNYTMNGDSKIRTTFHCEVIKMEFIASAQLQAIRFGQRQLTELTELSAKEAIVEKKRIDSILTLANSVV